ncbi:MAG: ABC transporter permease, partial [Anaerolineae bacterium]|nr:ABC transporter permease [Anaerolineae bacterium]
RMRYLALILGGALMGLGGAFLSLATVGAFTHGIINGRGWVAIAIVIFGNWKPTKVLAGALLFGALQALQLRLQAEGVALPYELLLALPYVITILVLALFGRNASYPASLLKPYRREG